MSKRPRSGGGNKPLYGYGRAETRNGRPSTTKNQHVYHDKRWYAARARVLRRCKGRCEVCGADVTGKYACRVDHIKTVAERPDLAFELSNLRALCVDCDGMRHREKGGGSGISEVRIGIDGWPIVEGEEGEGAV